MKKYHTLTDTALTRLVQIGDESRFYGSLQ